MGWPGNGLLNQARWGEWKRKKNQRKFVLCVTHIRSPILYKKKKHLKLQKEISLTHHNAKHNKLFIELFSQRTFFNEKKTHKKHFVRYKNIFFYDDMNQCLVVVYKSVHKICELKHILSQEYV